MPAAETSIGTAARRPTGRALRCPTTADGRRTRPIPPSIRQGSTRATPSILGGVEPTTTFVIDTSRNGVGPWQYPPDVYPEPEDWCNPPDRGLGVRPTTDTGSDLVDAFLWIKVPGESDGQCFRGTDGPLDPARGIEDPAAGQWFPQQAHELIAFADPALDPLTCNVKVRSHRGRRDEAPRVHRGPDRREPGYAAPEPVAPVVGVRGQRAGKGRGRGLVRAERQRRHRHGVPSATGPGARQRRPTCLVMGTGEAESVLQFRLDGMPAPPSG